MRILLKSIKVYEKYIEPHASKKRYNSDNKIVQLYGV